MHLDEVEKLAFKNYDICAKDCQEDRATKGVLILASHQVSTDVVENPPKMPSPNNVCSAHLYPAGDRAYCIQITGLYLPPSAMPCLEDMVGVTRPGRINRLLLGDFNPNSWAGEGDSQFHEWLAGTTAWELSDPALSTHEEGSSLDEIILVPG